MKQPKIGYAAMSSDSDTPDFVKTKTVYQINNPASSDTGSESGESKFF
jgi:hypothetical protein